MKKIVTPKRRTFLETSTFRTRSTYYLAGNTTSRKKITTQTSNSIFPQNSQNKSKLSSSRSNSRSTSRSYKNKVLKSFLTRKLSRESIETKTKDFPKTRFIPLIKKIHQKKQKELAEKNQTKKFNKLRSYLSKLNKKNKKDKKTALFYSRRSDFSNLDYEKFKEIKNQMKRAEFVSYNLEPPPQEKNCFKNSAVNNSILSKLSKVSSGSKPSFLRYGTDNQITYKEKQKNIFGKKLKAESFADFSNRNKAQNLKIKKMKKEKKRVFKLIKLFEATLLELFQITNNHLKSFQNRIRTCLDSNFPSTQIFDQLIFGKDAEFPEDPQNDLSFPETIAQKNLLRFLDKKDNYPLNPIKYQKINSEIMNQPPKTALSLELNQRTTVLLSKVKYMTWEGLC